MHELDYWTTWKKTYEIRLSALNFSCAPSIRWPWRYVQTQHDICFDDHMAVNTDSTQMQDVHFNSNSLICSCGQIWWVKLRVVGFLLITIRISFTLAGAVVLITKEAMLHLFFASRFGTVLPTVAGKTFLER